MGKRLYQAAGSMIRLFSRRMKTEWETPFEEGPCIFVVNHAGSSGPVNMCAKFPLRDRLQPWINEEMLSARDVPAYVRKVYWWKPGSFFAPVLNATVPYIAAVLMPPVLRSVDYIPVYHDQRIMLTMRQSIRALQRNRCLLLFPEMPGPAKNNRRWINTGWLRLGELWYRASGRALKIYPVFLDEKNHVFKVAAPVCYDPARRFIEQERELTNRLSKGMHGETSGNR